MKWFRVYNDLLNEPKVQKLPPSVFKVLINLWCIASKNDGVIPEDDLAYKLRMRPCHVRAALEMLFDLTLLEREANALVPHNWNCRQHHSDNSAAVKRAYREKSKDKSKDSPVLDTDTDTEQILGAKAPKETPLSILKATLDEDRAKAFIDHRQRLKAPLGCHAAKLLAKQLALCPDPNAAADLAIERGWRAVKPEWVANDAQGPPRKNGNGTVLHGSFRKELPPEPSRPPRTPEEQAKIDAQLAGLTKAKRM